MSIAGASTETLQSVNGTSTERLRSVNEASTSFALASWEIQWEWKGDIPQ
jgi:hypothetical protein